MNKKELVDVVAENLGITKKEAGLAVDAVVDAIAGAVATGDKVSLTGFGTFEVTKRNARQCRNMQTGDMMEVPAKMSPKFRPSKNLKEAVAELPVA